MEWVRLSLFISHSFLDHWSDALLPPPFLFPSPWAVGHGGGGLSFSTGMSCLIFWGGGDIGLGLFGSLLLLGGPSRITAFPSP